MILRSDYYYAMCDNKKKSLPIRETYWSIMGKVICLGFALKHSQKIMKDKERRKNDYKLKETKEK